jgi:ribosome maturation factor RimP
MMSKREAYEQKAEALIMPILQNNGFELYDVEYVKEGSEWYLRFYIDKEGGIDINDCELVSRAYSEIVDKEDFIEEAYILEVSSPGLGRTLKKDKHLEKSIGEEVEIKLYKPIGKQKEFVGLLKGFDKDSIRIETEEGTEISFERTNIALIRLTIDF